MTEIKVRAYHAARVGDVKCIVDVMHDLNDDALKQVLNLAAIHGHVPILEVVLLAGPAFGMCFCKAFLHAAEVGQVGPVLFLSELVHDQVPCSCGSGWNTFLGRAAACGQIAVMDAMMNNFDVEWNYRRILIEAAWAGEITAMKRVVILTGESDIRSIIDQAARYGHVEAMKLLYEYAPKTTETGYRHTMIEAAERGDDKVMALTYEWGELTSSKADGVWVMPHDAVNAALIAAAKSGKINTMTLALEWGADALDGAFIAAATGGNRNALSYMRQAGANNYEQAIEVVLDRLDYDTDSDDENYGEDNEELKYGKILALLRRWIVQAHHRAVLDVAMAFSPLTLPPYVVLHIIDLACDGPLTETQRVKLITGVMRGRQNLKS